MEQIIKIWTIALMITSEILINFILPVCKTQATQIIPLKSIIKIPQNKPKINPKIKLKKY